MPLALTGRAFRRLHMFPREREGRRVAGTAGTRVGAGWGLSQRQGGGGVNAANLGIDDTGDGENREHSGGGEELGAGGGVGKHEHRNACKESEGEPGEVRIGPHADG